MDLKKDINVPKYKLSKFYIYATIASLIVLLGYYYYRFTKYFDRNFADQFNVLSFMIFLSSVILLLLLFFKFKVKQKMSFVLIFFLLSSLSIFSYNFINPSICSDCKAEILVGERIADQGIISFLNNYHKPSLYKIKKSPQMHERFLQYDDQLGSNYKKLLVNIENEPPDIILSENTKEAYAINWRIAKHSPLWFCFYALWDTVSGDGYFSQIVIPANIITILYLISLYVFLGLFFGRDEYASKLSIIFLVLLLPAFLKQVSSTANDLILGVVVTWVFYFLLKNTTNKIEWNDLLVGLVHSVAVLTKFTSLTLLAPITLFYLIRFKLKGIPKLLVYLLCFAVIPGILYFVFGYDMVLNIITGSAEEFSLKAKLTGSLLNAFAWYVLYDQYHFGIAFVLLLIAHLFKVKRYLARDEAATFYMFIAFFFMLFLLLWGSGLSRHWTGFIPLTIPLLAHIYKNCEEKNKMILSTSIFLIINNLLILIHEGIIMVGYYKSNFNVSYWSY